MEHDKLTLCFPLGSNNLALRRKASTVIIFIKKKSDSDELAHFTLLLGLEKTLTFGIFIIENITC